MTLTAHDAIRHIQHTLASDSVPAVGAMRILNDAGNFLVNMQNWRWLESEQATLDFAKDTDYVWLPINFRELLGLQTADGLNQGIQMTTQQKLLELRSVAVANSFVYQAAVVHAQRQVAASSQLVSDVTPVDTSSLILNDGINSAVTFTFRNAAGLADPANTETATARNVALGATRPLCITALTDAINKAPGLFFRAADNNTTTPDSKLNLTYSRPGTVGNLGAHANWFTDTSTKFADPVDMQGGIGGGPPRPRLDIWPTPTNDSIGAVTVYYRSGWMTVENDGQFLYLPEWMETLYIFLVRTFARGYERESEFHIGAGLDALVASPLYLAAQQRDKEMTPSFGSMAGGAAQGVVNTYDYFWNFSSTSAPS
jgi:hypothetical protein